MDKTLEQAARRLYPDWSDEDIRHLLDIGNIWQDIADEQVSSSRRQEHVKTFKRKQK